MQKHHDGDNNGNSNGSNGNLMKGADMSAGVQEERRVSWSRDCHVLMLLEAR